MEKYITKRGTCRRRYLFTKGFLLILDGFINIFTLGYCWGAFSYNHTIKELKKQ